MEYISYENVSGAELVASPYTMAIGTEVVSTTGVIPELEAKIGLGIDKYVDGVLQTYFVQANPVTGALGSKGEAISAGPSPLEISYTGTQPNIPITPIATSGAVKINGVTYSGKYVNTLAIKDYASGSLGVTLTDLVLADNILVTNNGEFGLVAFSTPALAYVTGDLRITGCLGITSLSFPSLVCVNDGDPTSVGQGFDISSNSAMTSINLPVLTYSESLRIESMFNLSTLNIPNLLHTKSFTIGDLSLITSIPAPSLISTTYYTVSTMHGLLIANINVVDVVEDISIGSCNNLHTVNLSNLRNVGNLMITSGCPVLANITIGNALLKVSGGVNIQSVLTAASVNHILAKLVTLDGTNGTTNFNGTVTFKTTNPTGQGLTDKATLEGRGCVVTIAP